jgi:hypothetical protein
LRQIESTLLLAREKKSENCRAAVLAIMDSLVSSLTFEVPLPSRPRQSQFFRELHVTLAHVHLLANGMEFFKKCQGFIDYGMFFGPTSVFLFEGQPKGS